MFISYRETQGGDWLIFEAIPYTNGIGVRKVGPLSMPQGYMTGRQFGRADTESEAVSAAEATAYEWDAQVVKWQSPADFNPQFIALPKQYPEWRMFLRYASAEEAEDVGWIYINPAKTIEHYRGRKIYIADATPGRSQGYNFAIRVVGESDIDFAESKEVGVGERKVSVRFRTGDVVDGILAARRWIDNDLISQKEAAEMLGISIQAVDGRVKRDTLSSYYDQKSRRSLGKQRSTLMVSRSEVKRAVQRDDEATQKDG